MLVFQSFVLSFSILWRFVLTFPILVIGLLLYGLVGGLIGGLIGFIAPGAFLLILFLISASSSVIPILVGARFGFQSKHMRPSHGYKALIVPALAYGAAEAMVIGIASVPVFGFSGLMMSPTSLGLGTFDSEDLLNIVARPETLIAISVLPFVAVCAIRASLLVPMASASIGRDPDNRPYTPFLHFGSSFWELFGIVALSYLSIVVFYFVIFALFLVLTATGSLESYVMEIEAMLDGSEPFRFDWSLAAIIVAYLVVALWSFSLQCAGGVLAHLRLSGGADPFAPIDPTKFDAKPAPPPPSNTGPRMSAEDLRALRKSRQSRP